MYNTDETDCLLYVTKSKVDSYFFGSPFFYEYYAVFDMSNYQITVAPKKFVDNKVETNSNGPMTYSALGILGICGLCIVVWKAKKNSKEYSE